LKDVASHEGVVEISAVATDQSVGQDMKAATPQQTTGFIGFLSGYMCGKYRNELGQGLSIHEKLAFADGSPVADFTIDRSSCGF
jgi:hypothetical protein